MSIVDKISKIIFYGVVFTVDNTYQQYELLVILQVIIVWVYTWLLLELPYMSMIIDFLVSVDTHVDFLQIAEAQGLTYWSDFTSIQKN